MQVYRGMDIGTAKPTADQRRRVRHHLIDIAGVREAFDAARFVELARSAVADIQSRGKVPIFCGGTGLYFKAYSDGLGEAPPCDPRLRAELESLPLPELLGELERRDPATFERIDRCNLRRVVRALEVIRLTGKPFSTLRAAWPARQSAPASWFAIGLSRAPQDLTGRIDRRVDQMFADGLVDETRSLLEQGLAENRTAMQALGYRQVAEHLRGERSLAETVELIKIRTRQFAKRQFTWFRRQMALEWIDTSGSAEALAEQIIQKYQNI
jgi:tRNA dimethylallyltransferase